MKNLPKFILALFIISIVACKKDDPASGGGANPGDCSVSPYRAGTKVTTVNASNVSTTLTFDKDTVIAGVTYARSQSTGSSSGTTIYAYYGLNSAKEFLIHIPPAGDLPRVTMAYHKIGQPVNSTWVHTFQSVSLPTLVTHKYTFTVMSNSETFAFKGTNYTNGQRVKLTLDVLHSGTPILTNTSFSTFFCGLGSVKSEQNGVLQSTLTDYIY